jgi:LysM repeat protein
MLLVRRSRTNNIRSIKKGIKEGVKSIQVIIPAMKHPLICCGLLALALLSACAAPAQVPATSTPYPVYTGTLTPYQTRTPTITPILVTPATPTPLPTLTPTPRTHVVKAGEDMSGIALRYRVKLSDLKAANPSVTPNVMRIGTILIIPGNASTAIPNPTTVTPTQPPPSILVSGVRCDLDAQGGATCFVVAHNQGETAAENVSILIRLVDPQAQPTDKPIQQVATAPLNLLPAGRDLPLMVYFPAPLPARFQAAAELASSLPTSEGEKRYLALELQNKQVDVLPDGLTAEVSGDAVSQAEQDAAQVWVVAVAYDEAGNVVGLRRWQNSAPLPAGRSLPFSLQVYSTGAKIARVDLLGEARP